MTPKKLLPDPKVYNAHLMEGCASLEESIAPCLEFEKHMGYEGLVPERFQVGFKNQQNEDLKAVLQSDIIVADIRRCGDVVEGKPLIGKGTNREIGIVQGLNYAYTKGAYDKLRPIILVVRKNKRRHCFDLEGSPAEFKVTKVVFSMKEAAEYIKSGQWRKWK